MQISHADEVSLAFNYNSEAGIVVPKFNIDLEFLHCEKKNRIYVSTMKEKIATSYSLDSKFFLMFVTYDDGVLYYVLNLEA